MLDLIIYVMFALICLSFLVASYIRFTMRMPLTCFTAFPIEEPVYGVAYCHNRLYLLGRQKVMSYSIHGEKLNERSTQTGYLRSILAYKNQIYVTSTPEGQNFIEIFNLNLNHIRGIDIDVAGSLMWLDYFNNKFYGVMGFVGPDQSQTQLVEFTKDWFVKQAWHIPKTILDEVYPDSLCGGRFLSNGDIYVTGDEKAEIYIMRFKFGRLIHTGTLQVPITGNGIDAVNGGDLLYGSDNIKKLIVAMRDCRSILA